MSVFDDSPKGYFLYFDLTVVCLAVAANLLVLVAVIRGKFSKFQRCYQQFLISLGISDLYCCCVDLLRMGYRFYRTSSASSSSPPSFLACGANVLRSLQLAGFFVNLLNLVGMSVDHFYCVLHPAMYRNRMTDRTIKIAIGSIWLASFSIASLDLPLNLLIHNYGSDTGPAANVAIPSYKSLVSPWLPKSSNNNSDSATVMSSGFATMAYLEQPSSKEEDDGEDASPIEKLLDEYEDTSSTTAAASYSAANFTRMAGRNESDSRRVLNAFLSAIRDDEHRQSHACTSFNVKKIWFELLIIGLVIACSISLTVCYGVIFRKVSIKTAASHRGGHSEKLVSTTLMFLGAFALCWLPFMLFEFVMFVVLQTEADSAKMDDKFDSGFFFNGPVNLFLIQSVLSSLLQSYPLFDPFIYAYRAPTVKKFIAEYAAKVFPPLFHPSSGATAKQSDYRPSGTTIMTAADSSRLLEVPMMSPSRATIANSARTDLHLVPSSDDDFDKPRLTV